MGLSVKARDALTVAGVALAARLGVVLWAADVFPPSDDGAYYHVLAARMAEGAGYTWLWPDGAVTYAAHYPVGYPALVALGYAVFGPTPALAMIVNALLGTAGAVATWALAGRASTRRLALAAGLATALHPALVPYTAAVMTEDVTASLLVVAAALAARGRESAAPIRWAALIGLVMGAATLVRPQSLVLAPVLGALAARPGTRALGGRLRAPVAGAGLALGLALTVCAPWTARNCVRMGRCALVSVNGGWNLAIGTQTDTGGFRALVVPEPCAEVFDEAAKDKCFGREATGVILRDPLGWLARAPSKLRMTFDYFGAAPAYLHTANSARFSLRAKIALGAVETVFARLLLAAALVAILRLRSVEGRRDRARRALCAVGLVACVAPPGAIGYLALALAALTLGRRGLSAAPVVVPATAATILVTAAVHAVIFGAGRYGLVVVPFVTALAFLRPAPQRAADHAEAQSA